MAAAVLAVQRSLEQRTYHEGTIPLQTIRADIDYGAAESTHNLRQVSALRYGSTEGEVLKGEVAASDKRET